MALCLLFSTVICGALASTAAASERPIRIFMDGHELVFDMTPVQIDGRTLVPMRPIFEALQADISWDHERQTARAVKDENEIIIVRDSYIAWVNGQAFHLDVAARTMNDRMMVPLRFISESLDVAVQWTEAERRVDLFTDGQGAQDPTGSDSTIEHPDAAERGLAYPQRITGTKPVNGKLLFGTQAPRGLSSFTATDFFVDTQSILYYNIVLQFDEKFKKLFHQSQLGGYHETTEDDTFALQIRTYLWGPGQTLLLERNETDAQIRYDAQEFHTHNSIRLADLQTDFGTGDTRWAKGRYRLAVEVNDRLVFVEDFSIVESINSFGNTSGNLYNRGLVARQGDSIYYVGPDGGLYRKTIRGTDVVKLTSAQAEYLNTQGQWIYFVNRSKDGVVSRIRFDGKTSVSDQYSYYYNYRGETETLSHDASGQLLLVNDWLYYINLSDERRLYRMRTDGSDQELVIDQPLQQFYLHDRYIIYLTFDETFSDWSDKTNKKNRENKNRRMEEDYQLAVGHLYMAGIDGEGAKKLTEGSIIGMVVANQSVYCLTPKRGASWEAQISGRVPGNLYRIAIPESLADISENALVESALTEETLLAEDVMNFYVDSDWLMLQTNPNRGNVIQKYTMDGQFVEELDTKIGRKRYDVFNRTTFPVTLMNRAYEWIYYYAGNENERATDPMPLRNDRYRSIKENSIRELKIVEHDE